MWDIKREINQGDLEEERDELFRSARNNRALSAVSAGVGVLFALLALELLLDEPNPAPVIVTVSEGNTSVDTDSSSAPDEKTDETLVGLLSAGLASVSIGGSVLTGISSLQRHREAVSLEQRLNPDPALES